MSGEIDRLKEIKNEVNAISQSYCSAKWLQSTLLLQNGKTHSCHHPRPHAIELDEIRDNPSGLHNTRYKKVMRVEMINGKRPAECQFCWNIEDMPGDHISDRIIKSSESWSYSRLHEISRLPKDANVNPAYLEVSFSNLCNFKCSYCSPEQSSQWMAESKKYGPYPTHQYFNGMDGLIKENRVPIAHNDYNPYVEAFWKWWPELYETLKVFRITGGEPLLSEDTFKVLDYINENPNKTLEFSVNTNACVADDKIKLFVEKMRRITVDKKKIGSTRVYTSVDAHGKQAEYIRHGLDYDLWLKNLDYMLTELPETTFTVMCTSNIFSLFTMEKMLADIYALKKKHYSERRKVAITVDISILRFPAHQRADIITDDYWNSLDSALKYMKEHEEGNKEFNIPHYAGFFDFEIAKLERFIEFMKNGDKNEDMGLSIDSLRHDFYAFVEEHDRRRKTNLLEAFPELENFYKTCEIAYEQNRIK